MAPKFFWKFWSTYLGGEAFWVSLRTLVLNHHVSARRDTIRNTNEYLHDESWSSENIFYLNQVAIT